jgi:hypothetical protein
MDASNPNATTVEEYMGGTANYRTDLYSTCGTLVTHKESIELFKELGVKMTPELKSPSVLMPYNGYTQENYAQQMIDEYKAAGVSPKKVYAQSFNLGDLFYWIKNEPMFARQAVYLDGRYGDPNFDYTKPSTWSPSMEQLVSDGVNIIAPHPTPPCHDPHGRPESCNRRLPLSVNQSTPSCGHGDIDIGACDCLNHVCPRPANVPDHTVQTTFSFTGKRPGRIPNETWPTCLGSVGSQGRQSRYACRIYHFLQSILSV